MRGVRPVMTGAEAAATSSVGDPGATRTVYLIVVVLVLLAAALLYFAYRFWQRTRPGTEYVQPEPRSARTRRPRSSERPDGERRPDETRRPDPSRRSNPSRRPNPGRPDSGRRPSASRRPQAGNAPLPSDRPDRAPSADPFEDDPWWDTRAPRPRPKPSLRDPLL